jgi:hypothetical protein
VPRLLVAIVALLAGTANATCNVIPSSDRFFAGELGLVSKPFARPGDEIVVVRTGSPVFFRAAGANEVTLEFVPPSGNPTGPIEVASLAPESGSICSPNRCTATHCDCVRFVLPDTHAKVSAVAQDGLTLTGPAEIEVRTSGVVTARIGRLALPEIDFTDPLFPHFVALPQANRFADLVEGGGRVLGAEDTAGNLFIPFEFSGIVADDARRTRFLEAIVAGLRFAGEVRVDVFTVAGQRLPPLVKQVRASGDDVIGTADSRESVFRIHKGSLRPGLEFLADGKGPVAIPSVSAIVEREKQADPENMVVGERFAVYEARECDLEASPGLECVDLNDDGDVTDYFLYALDLTFPGEEPIVIHSVDREDDVYAKGTFPPFGLYSFSASDEVVAYRIIEGTGAESFDINGNGATGDVVVAGVFDLERNAKVSLCSGAASPRQEVAGSLVAFTCPRPGGDVLYWYDSRIGNPGPHRAVADGYPEIFVTRHDVGAADRRRRVHPFDLAVADRRIAAVVPEMRQGSDVTGDGNTDDIGVVIFDPKSETVREVPAAMAATLQAARLALADDEEEGNGPAALAFDVAGDSTAGVALIDLRAASLSPTLLCSGPVSSSFSGTLVPSMSLSIVACVRGGSLHVWHPGDAQARDLGITLGSPDDAQVSRDVLVVGVDEVLQHDDLDGDSRQDGLVLHTYHAQTRQLINFRHQVAGSMPPFIQFLSRGLALLTRRSPSAAIANSSTVDNADLVRTIFRDVDSDGHFEEPVPQLDGSNGPLADNCPTIWNPAQDAEACDCPALSVETVQAFSGSRVLLPIDFEPGQFGVAAMNFDVRYCGDDASLNDADGSLGADTLQFLGCRRGRNLDAAHGQATCRAVADDCIITVFIEDEGDLGVDVIGAGELVALEFKVAPGAEGQSVVSDLAKAEYFGTRSHPLPCTPVLNAGEIRVEPHCQQQGDCNCDGKVNSGDRLCLITALLGDTPAGECGCADCNLSGQVNSADAICATCCAFGECLTDRRHGSVVADGEGNEPRSLCGR